MRSRKTKWKWKKLVWPLTWWHAAAFVAVLLLIFLLAPSGREFKRQNPITTSLIDIRADEALKSGQKFNLRWVLVPLHKISPELLKAVIAGEDWNFFSHHGFDFAQVEDALEDALTSFSMPRGASTITQQLAKNLYLSESKNPFRKLLEAMITIKLEYTLSKSKILELYLNVIEFGQGVFGAEAASQFYFGTSAENLSRDQAAFLAAIIPNPRTVYNPKTHPRQVQKRKFLILEHMAKVNLPTVR